MNVGIDGSKRKSMMMALQPMNQVVLKPGEYPISKLIWIRWPMTFWCHECIVLISEAAFTECYRKWCRWKGYCSNGSKTADPYIGSIGHITTLPKNSNTKLAITAAKELTSDKAALAVLRAEMDRLARQLPEYEMVRAMYGVGERTAPQLMVEIGGVRRFPRRSSIVSFAGGG